MKRVVTLLVVASSAGCVYYNAMWSAERYAKDARHAEQRGRVSDARSQWALAAARAERVALRHPKSRWADDALALQAEGLARSGACDEAATPIKQVRETVNDSALRERVALAEAECALAAAHPIQAAAALALPLASKDDSRRSRAELLAGQTASQRFDYAAAVEHFARSRETAARPARVRALIAAGRHAEAAAALESLTGQEFEAHRGDLLAYLAIEAGAETASATLDRLLGRGKQIPMQEQARLLVADADRRLARGELDAASARYRRAASVAPAATNEAGRAALGIQRVLVASAKQPGDLKPIEADLARLNLESPGSGAKQLLDLVRQALGDPPPGTAAGFRAAELARDSLEAPALAGALFLAVAARDTTSLYAPKALVAAIALLPGQRDSLIGVLDTKYAGSPYTRAFHGEPSLAYVAAEDSLARELGVQVSRSVLARAGDRAGLPVPGPRGPQLEEAQPVARPAAMPARPANRPAAPASAPERP